MSSGEDRKVSTQRIQAVQNLIERCLQLYMNQKEVMDILFDRAEIEPDFTELVWQKLEDQNQEFFKAYHVCLMVKHQIMMFNNLLEKQVDLMRTMRPVGATSLPVSNGSHSSMHQAPFFVTDHTIPLPRPESMHHPIGSSSTFINGAQSMHARMQSVDDTSIHAGSMDASVNMHATQNSHTGMNGVAIKSEPRFADSSGYTFGADGNVLEIPPTIGGAVIPSFGSVEPNPQPMNGSLFDAETTSSFGFLGQIPRNFSLSDLTAQFSQSSEMLESYSRSPFLGTDVSAFLGSPGRECQGENGRLEAISEGLSYEEFCSD